MGKLASVNRETVTDRPKLITLTYPATWPEDWRVWKAHLAAFRRRLERRYGRCLIFWRLELQARGAPHFHLMVFHPGYIDWKWVAQAWNDIVAPGDEAHLKAGTEVRAVRSWRGVASYAAKYMTKTNDKDDGYVPQMGRLWGVWNLQKCHIVVDTVVLTLEEFHKARRLFAKYRSVTGRRLYRPGLRYQGLQVFMPAELAWRVLEWLGIAESGP